MKKFIVSRDDSIYEAWPSLVRLYDDSLVCIFTECEHHSCRDKSRIVYCKSHDRGRTWSKKIPLTYVTDSSNFYNSARITRLSDDSVIIVCDRVEGNENLSATRVYIWKCDKDCEKISEPILTPADGIVPDIKELKSGRWILSAHKLDQSTGKLVQYCWISDDKGKSWSDRIIIGKDERYNICETCITELEDDVLVAFIRENSGKGWDMMKSLSYDGGLTWDGVYECPVPGCHRPTSGILNDGRIFITYRFLQGGFGFFGKGAQNFFCAVIDKETAVSKERNKQSARIMPIDYDRSPVADLGYSGWVQFGDGEIYIVAYIVDDAPKAHIRGYSLHPEEIQL